MNVCIGEKSSAGIGITVVKASCLPGENFEKAIVKIFGAGVGIKRSKMTSRNFTYVLFIQITATGVFAQRGDIFPAEGQQLNYNIIHFFVPPVPAGYVVQVALGDYTDITSFKTNVIVTDTVYNSNSIISLPEFGKSYTWSYSYAGKKPKTRRKNALHHFVVESSPRVDSALYRLRINKTLSDSSADLFVLDYTRCIYGYDGKPKWFLKNIAGIVNDSTLIRDLKQTSRGTLTFLTENAGYEIDKDCRVLWKTPEHSFFQKDSSYNYHHDFTRLDNGNYMILGDEFVEREYPAGMDTLFVKDSENSIRRNGKIYIKLRMGNILEFDEEGKLAWYWRSKDYFTDAFLFSGDFRLKAMNISTHMNAFYFDQSTQKVYASFRDISTIIKIDHDSHKVEANHYGFTEHPSNERMAVFNAQHSCRVNSKGELYFFNNNTFAGMEEPAALMITRETNLSLELIKKITNPYVTDKRRSSMRGGNAVELPDGRYLCNMGSINQCFLADEQGAIYWNAIIEKRSKEKGWIPFIQYRIAPVNSYQLFK